MLDVQKEFNDLEGQITFLSSVLPGHPDQLIREALGRANQFMTLHEALLTTRKAAGFFRDGHGDLHTGNIFLLPEPQPFDCIEFNDALRRDDVLNEVAFLCMDLEAFGRDDLADLFLARYNEAFPVIFGEEDRKLFNYYKCYRANIRAKVNSIRARNTANETEKKDCLDRARKYLLLMQGFMKKL
jgi:aminoglycoside phosphotransferase family enzyme